MGLFFWDSEIFCSYTCPSGGREGRRKGRIKVRRKEKKRKEKKKKRKEKKRKEKKRKEKKRKEKKRKKRKKERKKKKKKKTFSNKIGSFVDVFLQIRGGDGDSHRDRLKREDKGKERERRGKVRNTIKTESCWLVLLVLLVLSVVVGGVENSFKRKHTSAVGIVLFSLPYKKTKNKEEQEERREKREGEEAGRNHEKKRNSQQRSFPI